MARPKDDLKTRVSEHRKAVVMFDHNSKLACHVHEHHHRMDFENVEVVRHEAHYHQRLFLEAWTSVKDPNAENDHMVIPKSTSAGCTHLNSLESRAYSTRNVSI